MSVPVPTLFKECHRLLRHMRDLKAAIERQPRERAEHDSQLEDDRQSHHDAHERLKKLKLEQKEQESLLKSLETQIDKLFQRSMEVTTMKEMEATRHELEHAREKKSTCEDAILTAIMAIEEGTADLPNVDRRWAEAQAQHTQWIADAAELLERMQSDLAASTAKLAETEQQLPEDVREVYSRLVKSYGADGLAAVKGRACQQCRTQMTEDKRDILASGKFMICSNCGRGLYPVE